MGESIISAEIETMPAQANEAALILQRLGYRVLHIGPTISVQGPQSLWESTFKVDFELVIKARLPNVEDTVVGFQKPSVNDMHIPAELQDLITGVQFVEPPELF